MALLGKPIDRIDAWLKVTGKATYAAEFKPEKLAYAFPVRATIANGTITAFDTAAAEKSGGVLAVLTHQNAPRLKVLDSSAMVKAGGSLGEQLAPIQAGTVAYFGQYIAVVVAETYEQARAAAALVSVVYAQKIPAIDLKKELPNGFNPQKLSGRDAQTNTGKAAGPLRAAPVKLERTYTTATENHHPMEPHATVAIWDGPDKLTVYDATQGVLSVRGSIAYFFDLNPENVRVLSPYVGGGFGSKGSEWGNSVLAAMAAKVVRRPVKLVLTRQMMQTNVGRRSQTAQTIALGADATGKLMVIRHRCESYTNLSEFFEPSGKATLVLYTAPIREVTYRVAALNIGAPTYMRAPGEGSGLFALESAMDEMAHELKLDPLRFRQLNYAPADPSSGRPFSSVHLPDCYRIGAEKIGWSGRRHQPRQLRSGNHLVGYGMATATYPARRSPATVRIKLLLDGSVTVMSATQDIGTGTYTIMAQTAGDALGIPAGRITVLIGDSSLPPASGSFGSMTAASITPAVLQAGELLREELLQLALADPKSTLAGREPADIAFTDAAFFVRDGPSVRDSYTDIMRRNNRSMLEVCTTAVPEPGIGLNAPGTFCRPALIAPEENRDENSYSFHSFGAQFAQVWVDEDLGTIRVKRFVSVHDVGRVLNEKTARSQIIGGVVYGLGSALMEETVYDQRWANPVARTLADYHVPVHLDIPPIDVYFIGKPDPHISPVGARGAGEIGTAGVSAAVANAVFNATGKRLRNLPLTPDKLL